jgi:flagella basal body P-ring formation protein FlgA
MKIDRVEIRGYRDRAKFLKDYQIDKIYISKSALKRNSATISALYKNGSKKRKLFFRYYIDATIGVYKTVDTIKRDTPLNEANLEYQDIKFTTLYHKPVTSSQLDGYRAKYTLSAGKILTQNHIKPITDVNMGDTLNATLFDGDVMVDFDVTALQEGDIGDTIYVKRGKNRKLKARIVSKDSVEIVQ